MLFMALSTAPASRSDGLAVCSSMLAAASSSCLRFPQAAGDGMKPDVVALAAIGKRWLLLLL